MPQFDMNNMSLRQNILRQEQLKKALKNKQHENKEDTKSATDNAELQEIIPENKVVKDVIAELDIMAEQNRAILNAHRNSSNGTSMVDRNQNTNSLDHVGSIHMRNVGFSEIDLAKIGDNLRYVTDEPLPPSNIDNNETENSDNNPNIYANKEKYTQEYLDGLNIGIDNVRFRCIIEDYFQKVTISGEEVYVLKSGTLTQVVDLISQIYVTEKLVYTPDYIPNPPDENSGYALVNQSTYDNRKANYYYMCYLNGITCTGHEFEDGTYNKEIARQCGLYEYEDVFANFVMDEDVQNYLQENFGITISTPPSEEYIELWNKLANLAAIGEDGKNTGEYNKYNVLKYFGLALSDSKFMNYADKLSFEPEENSILDNSWDIEAVKSVISERYPELLENTDVFTDELLNWIGLNAFDFMLYNQSKLRAGNIQQYIGYGNIPSWITYNTGTEFNKELLLKCCIQSMAELANIGKELGYEPENFINEHLAEYVTNMYHSEIENIEGTQTTGGPRRAPKNQEVPDYVMNFLQQKYGNDVTIGNYGFVYINDKKLGYWSKDTNGFLLSKDYAESKDYFTSIQYYKFKNGEAIPNYEFDSSKFYQTFINGNFDFKQYLQNADSSVVCSIMAFLANPSQDRNFWSSIKSEVLNDPDLHSYLYNALENILKKPEYSDLYNMLNKDSGNGDLTILYRFLQRRNCTSNDKFENPNVSINPDNAVQGYVGNCWFIASLRELCQDSTIRMILENNVSHQNGIWSVTIQGITYSYTDEQVSNVTELSHGNIKLKIYELAARDYYGINGINPFSSGGDLNDTLEFLMGDRYAESYDNGNDLDTIIQHIKSNMYVPYLGIVKGAEIYAIDEKTGKTVKLSDSHAYTIDHIDGEYFYLQDPNYEGDKLFKIKISDIKAHPEAFHYLDCDKNILIATLSQDLEQIIFESTYLELFGQELIDPQNGNFNYREFYNLCNENGINYFNYVVNCKLEYNANGQYSTRLYFYNKVTGKATVIIHYQDGNKKDEIMIFNRPTVYFNNDDAEGSYNSIYDLIYNEPEEQLKNFLPVENYTNPDGSIDKERMANELNKFVINGVFDQAVYITIRSYFMESDGSFDQEGYDAFLEKFSSLVNKPTALAAVADICWRIQFVVEARQALAVKNMTEDPFLATEALFNYYMNINNHPNRPDGSIYTPGMSFWDWSDVLTNPFASTEDYIAAINAMNAILHEANSLGVSLDAYVQMNPIERERLKGMLNTPFSLDGLQSMANIMPWTDEQGNTYYSISNQSSCVEAPEWFKAAFANGETLSDWEERVIAGEATEAEEKMYGEYKNYEHWLSHNSSYLDGLSITEKYNIYLTDMLYFNMWLNTEAILEGYTNEDEWETLYKAYCESDMKPF